MLTRADHASEGAMKQPTGSSAVRGRVAVLGSVNLDLALRVEELPIKGETVLSRSTVSGLGGKGANQAVAVARAGVLVSFLGAVGADGEGAGLQDKLAAQGVDVSGIRSVPDTRSGLAVVVVSARGGNQIVVAPGANDRIREEYVDEVASTIAAADVLVLQGEIPADANRAGIAAARRAGTRVVVNLAPVSDLGAQLAFAHPLVLNEIEAGQLTGRPVGGADDVVALAGGLRELARSVVVTVGAGGAVLVTQDGVTRVPAPPVPEVRDTTGAGDALVGVLAAALARGLGLRSATAAAVAAASRSVAEDGASEQYPDFSPQIAAALAADAAGVAALAEGADAAEGVHA
jgi:ribokinase